MAFLMTGYRVEFVPIDYETRARVELLVEGHPGMRCRSSG